MAICNVLLICAATRLSTSTRLAQVITYVRHLTGMSLFNLSILYVETYKKLGSGTLTRTGEGRLLTQMASHFRYSPLSAEKTAFRLLKLLPSSDSQSDIHIELSDQNLAFYYGPYEPRFRMSAATNLRPGLSCATGGRNPSLKTFMLR